MPAPKRGHVIGFRPRPAERELVMRAAERAGVTVSELIREATLRVAREVEEQPAGCGLSLG